MLLKMKYISVILLTASTVLAQTPLLPYAQCGGIGWVWSWVCETGYTCSLTDNAYLCVPDVGPIIPHALPYAQCGGQGFIGPSVCVPGWECVVNNQYFSQCAQEANYTGPPDDPAPNLANPGNYCGDTAVEHGYPVDCVPGWTCSGNYICVADTISTSSSTTAAVTTSTVPTTPSTPTTIVSSTSMMPTSTVAPTTSSTVAVSTTLVTSIVPSTSTKSSTTIHTTTTKHKSTLTKPPTKSCS